MLWNPLDPALAPDPYPRYAALRAEDPVHFEAALGWWFVTGYEEAAQVLREPGGDARFAEFQSLRMGRDVSDEPYARGLRNFIPAVPDAEHRRVRGTFGRHFTPDRVDALRETSETAARDLVEAVRSKGRADLVADLAQPLPMRTISALMGVPEDQWDGIVHDLTHFKRAVQFLPMDDDALAKANASIAALDARFADIVAARREDLGEDLLSMMVRDADDGVLTNAEVVANAWGIFAGGYDTTAGAISNALIELFAHPDQLDLLRREPRLIPNAVDEFLRLAGPVQAQHRVFDRPIEVGGHTIPAETPVIVYVIAASRDPRWFATGEELDVTREKHHRHLGFGGGKRACPGRHLARMTMEIMLTAVITGLDGLRLDGPVLWDVENLPALMPVSVPVAWDPAPVAA
jgi:cytochrome P450